MKKLYLVVFTFVLAFVLSGCGAPELSETYTSSDVEDFGKNVVSLIDAKDYQAVSDLSREDIKDALSSDVLADVMDPLLDNAGDFVDYKRVDVVGAKDNETDEDFATVVLICEYENSKLSYTITINEDYEIIGFYVK